MLVTTCLPSLELGDLIGIHLLGRPDPPVVRLGTAAQRDDQMSAGVGLSPDREDQTGVGHGGKCNTNALLLGHGAAELGTAGIPAAPRNRRESGGARLLEPGPRQRTAGRLRPD